MEDCASNADLEQRYQALSGVELDKRDLLRRLCDRIVRDTAERLDGVGKPERPILSTLRKIIELAGTNHQPVRPDLWRANQESGLLGDPRT